MNIAGLVPGHYMNSIKTNILRERDLDKRNITLSERNLPYHERLRCPKYLIVPDDMEIEEFMSFNMSIYKTTHPYDQHAMTTIIVLLVVIESSNMYCGDYVEVDNTIYSTSPVTAVTYDIIRFISPKTSDESNIDFFNSDITLHSLHIHDDTNGAYLTVDDRSYEITDVIFNYIRVDNVNLLKELKKLNVLTIDI